MPSKNRVAGAVTGASMVLAGRFVCHYLSGLIVWGSGDPEIPAWLWSLTYNGSYMLPELIVTAIVVALLANYIPEKK